MTARIRNLVIEAPDPEGLAAFYQRLLDLRTLRRPSDWMVIGRDGEFPRIAFDPPGDGWEPPGWSDPRSPRQVYLEIVVPDVRDAEGWLADCGAARLPVPGRHIWADPAGHPFELLEAPGAPKISTIVFDSADPRRLAEFYAGMLGAKQVSDADRGLIVVEHDGTRLGFARDRGHRRPRWPDPAYPPQMHLDIETDNTRAGEIARDLSARQLPDMGGSCAVYADPDGHPFCLCLQGQ